MKKQIEFKVNNFDLLRLLAATQVIVDHYIEHLNISVGSLGTKLLNLFPGVPVFFIISGYLISASFERNSNLKNYIRNRALRIFPGLWCCIFITVIIFSITGVNFFNKQVIAWLPSQLAGIIYTPKFLANYGFGSYNGSLWTIPVELQFYILLPVCYYFAPKNKINYFFFALLGVFVLLGAICQIITFSPLIAKLLQYSFISNFYLFLLGVILQRLRIYKSAVIYNKGLYWLAGYIVFSLFLSDYLNPVIFNFLYSFILGFCIISLAYTLPNAAEKILRSNDISYGIYIYHGLILTVIVQEKLTSHINIYGLIILTYIFAFFSWRLIEKPFIQLKKRTIKARPV
jgi:peptidoglycan/LPS O-acetylase OafA/YrhL